MDGYAVIIGEWLVWPDGKTLDLFAQRREWDMLALYYRLEPYGA